MENSKLKDAISILKEFTETKEVNIITETIELLQNEIEYNTNKWHSTLKEVDNVIQEYQEIANNHNCKIERSLFNTADMNYLEVYVSKKGYENIIFEASQNSKSIVARLECTLHENLEDLVKRVDIVIID